MGLPKKEVNVYIPWATIVMDDASEIRARLEIVEECPLIYYCDECSNESHTSIWHNSADHNADEVEGWFNGRTGSKLNV